VKMKYMNASDCHNHSNCSNDGKDDMELMCKRAQELGFLYYTVTDHCECDDYEVHQQVAKKSYAKLCEVQEKFAGKLNILKGIELGQPIKNLNAAKDALSIGDYDFILGSVHNVADLEDFFFLDYKDVTEQYLDGLLEKYFDEILKTIKTVKFDSLSHLTYPLRYIEGDAGIKVNMAKHQDKIDEVFKALIERDMALEINTSGLRQSIGRALPDYPYIKRFKELGGKYVTVGSDAHCVDDLGKGIDEGLDILKSVGFEEFTVFIKHEPHLIKIE